jgi:hypothetical protein
MKRHAGIVAAPSLLRGYHSDTQGQKVGVGRVRRPARKRDAVTMRAPLHVMPKVVHLHFVLGEGRIVLLDENFT